MLIETFQTKTAFIDKHNNIFSQNRVIEGIFLVLVYNIIKKLTILSHSVLQHLQLSLKEDVSCNANYNGADDRKHSLHDPYIKDKERILSHCCVLDFFTF